MQEAGVCLDVVEVTALRSDETIRQIRGERGGHVSGAEDDDNKLSVSADMDTAQDQIRYSTAPKCDINKHSQDIHGSLSFTAGINLQHF